jgi:hypothetical protein
MRWLVLLVVLVGCDDKNKPKELSIYEERFAFCQSVCPAGIARVSFGTLSGTLECHCK